MEDWQKPKKAKSKKRLFVLIWLICGITTVLYLVFIDSKNEDPSAIEMFFFMISLMAFCLPIAWYIFWFVLGWCVDLMIKLGHPGIPEADEDEQ